MWCGSKVFQTLAKLGPNRRLPGTGRPSGGLPMVAPSASQRGAMEICKRIDRGDPWSPENPIRYEARSRLPGQWGVGSLRYGKLDYRRLMQSGSGVHSLSRSMKRATGPLMYPWLPGPRAVDGCLCIILRVSIRTSSYRERHLTNARRAEEH